MSHKKIWVYTYLTQLILYLSNFWLRPKNHLPDVDERANNAVFKKFSDRVFKI